MRAGFVAECRRDGALDVLELTVSMGCALVGGGDAVRLGQSGALVLLTLAWPPTSEGCASED